MADPKAGPPRPKRRIPERISTSDDIDDDLYELTMAHIMDMMETGTFSERTAIVQKFGPVLMRKKDKEEASIDLDAVRAEVRGWIEATGRSFFND